jgi:hypothetical protein
MKPRHDREPTTFPSTPRRHATLELPPPSQDDESEEEDKTPAIVRKRMYYQRTQHKSTFFKEENPSHKEGDGQILVKSKKKSIFGCF